MSDMRLGTVLGFEIRIDLSWFVIFFLIFWSLTKAVFPAQHPELDPLTYVAMGLTGTLLFFGSLLLHELSHAIVSRSKGIPVEGITLFIFGGVAHVREEPDNPRDELLIAGVGPLTSLALSACFELLARAGLSAGLGPEVWGVAGYLAFINLVLAVFNLMPGFPLDGGRVFRAAVWAVTGNRTKATRMAALGGQGLGTLLMVLGAFQALSGAALGGLWLVFIGWFLRSIAGASLQQHVLRQMVRGFSAADLMTPDPEVVDPDLRLDALLGEHFAQLRHGSYPVVERGEPVGLITLNDVRNVPRDRWHASTVRDAMTPLAECTVMEPRTSLADMLEHMAGGEAPSRVLVLDRGRLLGIVSGSDVARWIARVQALEDLLER